MGEGAGCGSQAPWGFHGGGLGAVGLKFYVEVNSLRQGRDLRLQ